VLDTEDRVISMRASVKAIANIDGGKLGDYTGIKALNPYLNSDLVLGETIDFNIPGTQFRGKGIKAETFLDICNAYVTAFSKGELKTD
jgi:hypothetical protein